MYSCILIIIIIIFFNIYFFFFTYCPHGRVALALGLVGLTLGWACLLEITFYESEVTRYNLLFPLLKPSRRAYMEINQNF